MKVDLNEYEVKIIEEIRAMNKMMRMKSDAVEAERNTCMFVLRKMGYKFKDLCQEFNVSLKRASDIVKKTEQYSGPWKLIHSRKA